MLDPTTMHSPERIRVLLSEGSSLSARQTITALGQRGYVLDVCDPDPLCLGRFSRFVRHYYRSPAAGTDPLGYLAFMLDRLTQDPYDVLLPVHEQAFLFAKVRDRLPPTVGVALADFAAFMQVQSKAAFTRLLAELVLPQPASRIVRTQAELAEPRACPYYVKTAYSTAGQGVWRVEGADSLARAIAALAEQGLLDGETEIVVQDVAPGALCQVQAVFAHGQLVAVHCMQTRGVSLGGGHSARVSVDHPAVRTHIAQLGRHLIWHGPIALDYLFDEASGQPSYIEANPRLVEPMNAALSGVNLAALVVRVALGEAEVGEKPHVGRIGVRSHSLLAILLGVAGQGGSRRDVVRHITQAILHRGLYADSREDVTPLRNDPASVLPLAIVIGHLLRDPRAAKRLGAGAIAAYSLTADAVETILALKSSEVSL